VQPRRISLDTEYTHRRQLTHERWSSWRIRNFHRPEAWKCIPGPLTKLHHRRRIKAKARCDGTLNLNSEARTAAPQARAMEVFTQPQEFQIVSRSWKNTARTTVLGFAWPFPKRDRRRTQEVAMKGAFRMFHQWDHICVTIVLHVPSQFMA
jgi:hypothetical protein